MFINNNIRFVGVLASLALLQANSHTSDSYAAPVEEERPKTAAELLAKGMAPQAEVKKSPRTLQTRGFQNLVGAIYSLKLAEATS